VSVDVNKDTTINLQLSARSVKIVNVRGSVYNRPNKKEDNDKLW
jgi:hypothetical protein